MNRMWILLLLAGCGGTDVPAPSSAAVSGWIMNDGATGYGGHAANVTSVSDEGTHLLVRSTGIPFYEIGPWPGNPNVASPQDHVWYIPTSPVEETGATTATPLGPMAVWTNGVPAFNALDARSYNNAGVWHQNAHFWEGDHMDAANGHPAQGGVYHHHFHPVRLLATHYGSYDRTTHSPIIGWAFDGFPICGPFGEAGRARTSYRLRAMTTRANGPAVSATYPLGAYVEDYEYVAGLGDLDEHNGHFGSTPEYPSGIYHYHVTINEAEDDGEYPFIIGPTYYGVVDARNFR